MITQPQGSTYKSSSRSSFSFDYNHINKLMSIINIKTMNNLLKMICGINMDFQHEFQAELLISYVLIKECESHSVSVVPSVHMSAIVGYVTHGCLK